MQKVFHVYCDGFSKTTASKADAQAYIDWLRTRGCVGKEVVVTLGEGTLSAAVFNPANARRSLLSAAA